MTINEDLIQQSPGGRTGNVETECNSAVGSPTVLVVISDEDEDGDFLKFIQGIPLRLHNRVCIVPQFSSVDLSGEKFSTRFGESSSLQLCLVSGDTPLAPAKVFLPTPDKGLLLCGNELHTYRKSGKKMRRRMSLPYCPHFHQQQYR